MRNLFIGKEVLPRLYQLVESRKLNGYIAVTGLGRGGMEESYLVLKEGNVVLAYYEHLKYHISVGGDPAVPLFQNTLLTKGANLDVVELSLPKTELVITFNREHSVTPFRFRNIKLPDSYSDAHVERYLSEHGEERERENRLIKWGLIKLGGG